MDSSDAALLGAAGVVAVTVVAAVLAGAYLFDLGESTLRPFALLVREPFAWIVVAALVIAAVGNAYIDG